MLILNSCVNPKHNFAPTTVSKHTKDQNRHGCQDDQSELPPMDKGVDEGGGEDGHEEEEHSYFFPNTLL